MSTVFADTGFWIAIINPRDSLHATACAIADSMRGRRIVTTQMVLTEFLNDMASRGTHLRSAAFRIVKQIQDNSDTTVVPQSDIQFTSALSLYAERTDKAWSLTDCASLLVMGASGISEALTYDKLSSRWDSRLCFELEEQV